MVPCPRGMPYEIPVLARSYASFAGILAGFAFAAVVQTLTRPSGKTDEDAHAVVALMSAFVGFLLAALLYGALGAENSGAAVEGRAATEELVNGVTVGFAALTLLYGVVVMIDSRNLITAARGARFMVGVLVPALVTLQVAIAGGDTYFTELVSAGMSGHPCSLASYDTFSMMGVYVPTMIVLTLSVTVWFLREKIGRTRLPELRNSVPYITLAIVLVSAVLFSFIPPLNNAYRLPQWALYLLVSTTALFAAFISILTITKPEPTPKEIHSGRQPELVDNQDPQRPLLGHRAPGQASDHPATPAEGEGRSQGSGGT